VNCRPLPDVHKEGFVNQMRVSFKVLGVFLVALFLSSCGGSQAPNEKSEVPRMTVEELKERIDNGDAIVIGDTRGRGSYNTRHVAGAISIPESDVKASVGDLHLDQEIVLYCT